MCSASRVTIRKLDRDDVPCLISLCAEHASYEGNAYDPSEKIEGLQAALIASALLGWIAECKGELVAYATATIDFSTWDAAPFMHLDCLFVREAFRGRGLGRSLVQAAIEEANGRGIRHLQWQTPSWNLEADRFYRRLGAIAHEKLRYRLSL